MGHFNTTSISVYRVGRQISLKITAEELGFAGRWNDISTPCVYASPSLEQAIIELSIHNNFQWLNNTLLAIRYDLPPLSVYEVDATEIPVSRLTLQYDRTCQRFGSQLLRGTTAAAFSIPSVVLPDCRIFILNPWHPAIRSATSPEYVKAIFPAGKQ